MPNDNFTIMIERSETRALKLMQKHGVYKKDVMGAFPFGPQRSIEFLLHEVAHWLTLGGDSTKVPSRLSRKMSEHFDRIPPSSADSLEIDTAIVTYLAGWALDFWKDPGPIVDSCRRNLRGPEALGKSDVIYQEFVARWTKHRRTYAALAHNLAVWFIPSRHLKEFPEAFP